MRSAILKPDVPPHSFPALKIATEDEKQGSSKAPAKAAAKKSKTGSKRKVSNPGFDEFGDAAIDDADLALAEKGGFEDIDDFDDDLGPIDGNAKKKQKRSDTNEDVAKEFEPRQLDNGKWACNHACKDKTACKHLCCREGLDKKPKVPKPRVSKKDNTAPDPKQTQLSMSVSKKAEAPSMSQSTQAPKLGPEFHNINTLHNNVDSNTRQVPLLSKTLASPQRFGSSALLPNVNRYRRPLTEAVREAEQRAFSDDFGDLDDLSLNSDPVLAQASTRTSLLQRSGSDVFEVEGGHVVDSFSSTQKDEPHLFLESGSKHQNPEWESMFDFDVEDDILKPVEQDLNHSHQLEKTDPKKPGPFEDMRSDSAAFDLGCRPQARQATPVLSHDYERAGTSDRFKTQSVLKEHLPAVSDGSMQSDDKNLLVEIQENVACVATLTADLPVEERPGSSDSSTRHFMEELGADLFNYVG